MRIAVAAVVVANLAGCGEVSKASVTTEIRDSAGIQIIGVLVPPSDLPEWTLEPSPLRVLTGAEAGDSAAFALVGPVKWLADGRLAIADAASQRILIYDAAGRFVRSLGRRGDGPGELRRLESVAVHSGDSLTTFDAPLRRLSVWHPDSGFVRSVNLGDGAPDSWPSDAWLWRDGLVVLYQLDIPPRQSVLPGAGVRRWQMRAHLTLRDGTGRILAASPSFDAMYNGLDERGDMRLPFSNRPFVVPGRNHLYFGSGSTFQISHLDSMFALKRELHWPAQTEQLTPGEVERVLSESRALAAERTSPERARTAFTKNFAPEILPALRPAIGHVLVGSRGELWVERFEAMPLGSAMRPSGARWTIISRDGLPMATLKLPATARLEDVREDEVVVVQRDSVDVQTVAVFRLKR